jgi:hypothetical protein
MRQDIEHYLDGRTDHGLVVECHAIACTEGSGGRGKVRKDEKCLAPHFRCFGSDNVDKFSIGGEKGIQLRSNFFFVYLVIEIIDIKSRVGLSACVIGHGQ